MEMEDTVVEGVEVAEDIVQGVVAEGAAAEGEADQIYECVNSIDFFLRLVDFVVPIWGMLFVGLTILGKIYFCHSISFSCALRIFIFTLLLFK
jgi:hypothetical protein